MDDYEREILTNSSRKRWPIWLSKLSRFLVEWGFTIIVVAALIIAILKLT